MWDIRNTGRWRAEAQKQVEMLSEKGFWEGGVITEHVEQKKEALLIIWTRDDEPSTLKFTPKTLQ